MPHHWPRPSLISALNILQILEATLSHERTTNLLRFGCGIHRMHVLRRDCPMKDHGRDRQIDVFAENNVLLGALDAFLGEVGGSVFGVIGAILGMVQLYGGARKAAFWAYEVNRRNGDVFEGETFSEGFGVIAFAVGETFAKAVFDPFWETHDGRRGARTVTSSLSRRTLVAQCLGILE